jgi:hypothetical protein
MLLHNMNFNLEIWRNYFNNMEASRANARATLLVIIITSLLLPLGHNSNKDISWCSPFGVLWFTTILWRTPKHDKRPTFSSISPIHVVGAQSLEVGLMETFRPSQTFPEHKSTTWKLLVTLSIETSIWKNLMGVVICLGQIIDLIFSLDSK